MYIIHKLLFHNKKRKSIKMLDLDYLYNQRWCNFKQEIQNQSIKNITYDHIDFDNGQKKLVIGKVEIQDQKDRYFMMPLAKADPQTSAETIKIGNEQYQDAVQQNDFWASFMQYLEESGNTIKIPGGWTLEYHNLGHEDIIQKVKTAQSKPLNVEQSNTTIVVGDKELAFKLERMLDFTKDITPELEMNEKLMRENSSIMPPTYGYLLLHNDKGEQSSSGIIQKFVSNKGDLWNYSVAYLKDKLQQSYLTQTTPTPENNPEFMGLMQRLNQKTDEMLENLSREDSNPNFTPEKITPTFIRNYEKQLSVLLYQTHRNIAENINNLPEDSKNKAQKLLDSWSELTNGFVQKQINLINKNPDSGYICRVHGDFHLGQVMVTNDNDLCFIDFAGEPGLPIEQRKQKHIYVRDIAGMYRSVNGYLGAVAVEEFADNTQSPELRQERKEYAQKAITPLINTASNTFLGKNSLKNPWLSLEVFRKNLYEVNYEVCNRPQMAYVPINGLSDLLTKDTPSNIRIKDNANNR